MQPRLSRHRILVARNGRGLLCPLSFLDSGRYKKPDHIEEMFNKPSHGLNRDELIETLLQLSGQGLIEGSRDQGVQTILLDRQTIVDALVEPPPTHNASCTCYRLSQEGGSVWEAFAAPDWSRLVKEERRDFDSGIGTITGMVGGRVEKYLRYLGMLDCEIDRRSIQVEEIGPWEATYWKILPHGHRVQFSWRQKKDPGLLRNDYFRLAFSGLCEFRDGWYRWR